MAHKVTPRVTTRRQSVKSKTSDVKVTKSSGNVFADLGLPASPQDMMKVEIAFAITKRLQEKKLTQAESAKLLETDQARISDIMRGRLEKFSVSRLLDHLMQLGIDIDIQIKSKAHKRQGRIKVENEALA